MESINIIYYIYNYPHPSYSLDLAPCDIFFFPKIESVLKGRRLDLIDDTKRNSSQALRDISKKAFYDCCAKWKHCCDKCVKKEEEYFEAVMPDFRGVGESRIYSKRAKKNLFAGFVPQTGITALKETRIII